MSDDEGSVVTVTGRIDPSELGVTLTHEHMFFDASDQLFTEPDHPRHKPLARESISLENRGYIQLHPTANKDDLRLESMDEAIEEVRRYKRAGGDSVVDVTPKAVGNDPLGVRAIASDTGLNFVQGTAYYARHSHPNRIDSLSGDEIEAEFVDDVTNGIDDTDVRAGIIGEIGLNGDIHEAEEKVLRAGARAARRTGAPLSVHPPLFHEQPPSWWGLRILDIAGEEGLPSDRVIVDHQDFVDPIDHPTVEHQLEIAKRGGFVEFDLWGWERDDLGRYQASPSDNWRIRAVCELIDHGYASNLLFSQDIWNKLQRTRYGGFGYAHLLEHVVPRLRNRGVSRSTIDQILIDNPRRALTFIEPTE